MAQTALVTDSCIFDLNYVLRSGASPAGKSPIIAFQSPQGTNNELGNVKTAYDTSLQDKKLSEPESFDVCQIIVEFLPNAGKTVLVESDIMAVINSCYMIFFTAGTQTRSWEGYLAELTPATGFQVSNGTPQWGAPSPNAVYQLDFGGPVMIGIGETFSINYSFPTFPSLVDSLGIRTKLRGKHFMVDITAPELNSAGQPTGRTYSTRRSSRTVVAQ